MATKTLHERLNLQTQYSLQCNGCGTGLHNRHGRVPLLREAEEAGWGIIEVDNTDQFDKDRAVCPSYPNCVKKSPTMATPVMKDGKLENFMVKKDGKPFHCQCGGNVFTKPDSTDLSLYQCNGCDLQYRSEE